MLRQLMGENSSNYAPQTTQRFTLIEIIALWEGRLTTKHLCDSFDIGRQQASKDINLYINEIAPDNLRYDKSLRGYAPTDAFRPYFTQGHASEYLILLNLNHKLVKPNSHTSLTASQLCSVSPPPRSIKPEIMRAIIRAISEKKRLEIEYRSLDNPEGETRVIAPHSLIETPLRWHVRAYCEKNKTFRDFVLSRFIDTPSLLDLSPYTIDDDDDWCTPIQLILEPDSRLADNQRNLIEQDYGMKEGKLELDTRLALMNYLIQSLGLSLFSTNPQANFQQITIQNFQEIKNTLAARNLLPI
ncbi:WYL domain-containing protein [Vibrio sp.]|nr:WYL domain-containing protein [Vibrio sp.]